MAKLEIIGFHATSQKNVHNILRNGFKINNKRNNEWLGYGIYLFEHHIDALTWGEKTHYCQPKPQVIRCYIKVEENKYLNLDDSQQLSQYNKYYEKTLKKVSQVGKEIIFKNRNEAMCWGLNLYKKEYEIDAIKYTFQNNRTKNIKNYASNKFSYSYNETQICITNNEVIEKMELYS